jgi:hypothetical protein
MKMFYALACAIVTIIACNVDANYIDRGPQPEQLKSLQTLRDEVKDTRYKSIKANAQKTESEMTFWPRQLSEHALFLYLGLEDAALKKEAQELHDQFEAFRKKMNPSNYHEVLPLSKRLREFKMKVLTTLNDGKWIGWVYPQLARHIILELDYFVDKLNNIPYTDQQEISFWDIINDDHSMFSSHLLDPSERKLFNAANELTGKLNKVVKSEDEMMLHLSLKAAKELDEYHRAAEKGIADNSMQSIIHPALIAHVVREGQRSVETLEKLVAARKEEKNRI